MKVIYFGTPAFAAEVLTYLVENRVDIKAVVTKPDKPKGRSLELQPTPVKLAAEAFRIPVFQPPIVSDLAFKETLEAFKADLFVVVAYGEIMKQHLLDMPASGCINLHASLLPRWRGAAPIQKSIIEGDKESGVTIMHMVKKMDAGDMIKSVRVPIGPDMTFGELEKKLCEVGKKALLETIRDFEKGIVQRTPQNEADVTYAPKIELEDCELNWNEPAIKLHNLVRGTNPYPGAWVFVNVRGEKKRLKVLLSRAIDDINDKPGAIQKLSHGLVVACQKGGLKLLQIQMEGKKAMAADEFLRGFSLDSLSFFPES